MGKITGFLEFQREKPPRRPVAERLKDWHEFEGTLDEEELASQGARCMDCGIPFCHTGCPLGNIIPDWNDLVYRGRWQRGARRACTRPTTSRSSPAASARRRARRRACSASTTTPVTIKQIEKQIVDRAFDERLDRAASRRAHAPARRSRSSAPGPAGLACAQQLARAGPLRRPCSSAPTASAGCCATASPTSRWRSTSSTRRIEQMAAEGVSSAPSANVGVDVTVDAPAQASSTRSCSPAAPPRRATCRSPGASSRASTSRWSSCRSRTSVCAGDAVPRARSRAERQARGHPRRRRHRLRLPRHVATARAPSSVHQFELLPRAAGRAHAATCRGRTGR